MVAPVFGSRSVPTSTLVPNSSDRWARIGAGRVRQAGRHVAVVYFPVHA
jgi:hypothetical protein